MAAGFDRNIQNLPQISKTTFAIGGIQTHVFGLDQLPSPDISNEVACLFVMHPRLETADYVEPIARRCLAAYQSALNSSSTTSKRSRKGLIAVAFDQRNHGSRLVNYSPLNLTLLNIL